jgi:hypothetical protein
MCLQGLEGLPPNIIDLVASGIVVYCNPEFDTTFQMFETSHTVHLHKPAVSSSD